MNCTAKTEYACLALVELGIHHGRREPLPIRGIAERNGIPFQFLVQILQQLRSAGLVTSTRGVSGGYLLAKSPESISLFDILAVTEGMTGVGGSFLETTSNRCNEILKAHFTAAHEAQIQYLQSVSLADMINESKRSLAAMYYI